MSDLIPLVKPESVDCIVTFPSPDPSMHDRLGQLAEFASYALKSTEVMAVLTTGQYLAPVLSLMNHPEISCISELDYRPPIAIKSAPPHRVLMRRMPLLVFGKDGFRLHGGDDVIEVPPADSSDARNGSNALLDIGMALIMERLTSPGQIGG